MSKIFLTSDLHFNHDREFIYGPRGFKSVEEMAEEMLDTFADCWMNGEEEILYLGNYAITHD